MISRNGVYYDLAISPYRFQAGDLLFHFSSELHRKKFQEKREEHHGILSESLSKRFNLYISCQTLSDIVLYRKIEQRGSYIRVFSLPPEEGVVKCLSQLRLNGDKVISKHCVGK